MVTFPRYDKRTTILGSTGSGKTVFGCWLLSIADFDKRPWFIFDFKGDELIAELDATDKPVISRPELTPGLYTIRPLPGDEPFVSEFFRRVWETGNCGIYIDEGYMIPKNDKWFRACLTQGRSKHIQMIILSQRPVWMDKFVFTEANYFAVFNLNNSEDRKYVKSFLNENQPELLPAYHSLWYDVGKQDAVIFKPAPDADTIINNINTRIRNYEENENVKVKI
jgi:DNA helicase HerA-like ATPase